MGGRMPGPDGMSEAEFQAAVLQMAKLHRVKAYHTFDSRRSVAGYPDLTLVGGRGTAFRELKTMTGKVSPDQLAWLDALAQAGQDVGIWRPDQLRTDVLDTMRRLGPCLVRFPGDPE